MASIIPDEPMDEENKDEEKLEIMADEAFARRYDQENSWQQLQEDEHGHLRVDRISEQRAKRQRLISMSQSARIKKGLIRYLVLVVDLSRACSTEQLDLRPNRLSCMIRVVRKFVRDYFDQNPLSQLGIVITRDGVAIKLTDLSGSPDAQIKKLGESNLSSSGDASLQNVLDLGLATLESVPPYGFREILVLFSSLATRDPGNILTSIQACKQAKVRVSVVGVAAEVYVCKRAAEETGGLYGVASSESHFEDLVSSHAPPPAVSPLEGSLGGSGSELVQMGFPQRLADDKSLSVFVGAEALLQAGGFVCPRCKARVKELPCECHVCRLTLISSPHLARSYHHLFPVAPFEELSSSELRSMGINHHHKASTSSSSAAAAGGTGLDLRISCYGCMRDLTRALIFASNKDQQDGSMMMDETSLAISLSGGAPMVLRCPLCRQMFCFDCDVYIHDALHNCPSCEMTRPV